jgi:hypothetical protein
LFFKNAAEIILALFQPGPFRVSNSGLNFTGSVQALLEEPVFFITRNNREKGYRTYFDRGCKKT